MKFLPLAALLLATGAAQAQLYQCVDASGHHMMSDSICEGRPVRKVVAPLAQPIAHPQARSATWVANCDHSGCWDKDGARYRPAARARAPK